jgi:hypothetical protein
MDARIRREALKAAAKVALSLAAVGAVACGAKTDEQKTEESASMTGTSPAPNGTGNAGTTPGSTPTPTPTPTSTSTPTVDAAVADAAPDLAQCEAKLAALVAARAPDAEARLGTAFETTPENLACCNALLEEYAQNLVENPTQHRWDCCATINGEDNMFSGGPGFACTPWGPPMPPAFRPAAAPPMVA